jgi:DNA-binding response OmpR family regulator
VARILLVQDDPVFCDGMKNYLESRAAMEIEHAPSGMLGAKMMAGGRFDVALINATLPDTPGIELAQVAANENTAVLMLSDNRRISRKLTRLGYRFLERPFSFDALLGESGRLIREREESISQIRSSTAIAEASLRALRAEVAEAHRLFDAIIGHLGYIR